ncbi:MAG: flippase-like domain-containing protein [Treponema sp.]|nr:flippase-like domain-containing protein [Treponema sp.]
MRKKVLWACVTLALSAFAISALFYNGGFSFAEFLQDIKSASSLWLCAALLCAIAFIFFEGRALALILRALGYSVKKRRGFLYAAADIYFSSITPSATGGQPASAWFMSKDGIKGAQVAAALLLNLTMYTLALVGIGAFSIIVFPHVFIEFNTASKLMNLFGILAMSALAFFFILLLKKQSLVRKIGSAVVFVLKKIHLENAAHKFNSKIDSAIEKYNECVAILAGRKRFLARIYLLNLLQRSSQILVTVFCFFAMRGDFSSGLKIFAIQTYVALGSNFLPVPGAAGVSEFIMYFGYMTLMGEEEACALAILSRGISFYACSALSLMAVMLGYVMLGRDKNKSEGIQ